MSPPEHQCVSLPWGADDIRSIFTEAIEHFLAVLTITPGARTTEDNLSAARSNLLHRVGPAAAEAAAPNDAAGRKRKVAPSSSGVDCISLQAQ
jgi:hypothetical protein